MVTGALNLAEIPDDGSYSQREILRYALPGGGDASALPLDECLALAKGAGGGRIVWSVQPVSETADGICVGPLKLPSDDLRRALRGCGEAVVLAATLGLEMDRLIARYKRISPVRALVLHAIGAERIEHALDVFSGQLSGELALERKLLRPRFSPGYGDLPLAVQPDIFALLDCERRLGLTLNESLIMTPSKSVTAIAGIRRAEEDSDHENRA